MEKKYNQYNLEALFRNFLIAENVSSATLKNYLSDFRYFEGWLTSYAMAREMNSSSSIAEYIEETITETSISEYRHYLIESELPGKTINRRLSTLRRFCHFCISQAWLTENPAKQLKNLDVKTTSSSQTNSLLAEFEADMTKETIKNGELNPNMADINEFFSIIS